MPEPLSRVGLWAVRDDAALFTGYAIAGLGPLTVAALMTPLRDHPPGTVLALFVLTLVIAGAAALAGPRAGIIATVCAGLSTDFLFVQPYLDLKYRPERELWPAAFIVVAGISIAALSVPAWRRSGIPARAAERQAPSRHIDRVVHLIDQDADVRDLISAVQAELTTLLLARACRFEPDDLAGDGPAVRARLERNGSVSGRGSDPVLPSGELELPVQRGTQRVGHFVIEPTPDTVVPIDRRIVAVVLTDHLAAAIARRHPTVPPRP